MCPPSDWRRGSLHWYQTPRASRAAVFDFSEICILTREGRSRQPFLPQASRCALSAIGCVLGSLLVAFKDVADGPCPQLYLCDRKVGRLVHRDPPKAGGPAPDKTSPRQTRGAGAQEPEARGCPPRASLQAVPGCTFNSSSWAMWLLLSPVTGGLRGRGRFCSPRSTQQLPLILLDIRLVTNWGTGSVSCAAWEQPGPQEEGVWETASYLSPTPTCLPLGDGGIGSQCQLGMELRPSPNSWPRAQASQSHQGPWGGVCPRSVVWDLIPPLSSDSVEELRFRFTSWRVELPS